MPIRSGVVRRTNTACPAALTLFCTKSKPIRIKPDNTESSGTGVSDLLGVASIGTLGDFNQLRQIHDFDGVGNQR